MRQKYLTKSLFKIGLECPRKLYYHEHPELYQNQSIGDPFLEALAEGGFQVGALAKIYHPEGIDLAEYSTEEAIKKTKELLRETNVTVFEAAFYFENLLVRTDILVKNGDDIEIFEVKSKSIDTTKDTFLDKKTKKYILFEWLNYLSDIAYQTYVCKKTYPEFNFIPFLTLVNKNSVATVDGLNQRFQLKVVNGRKKIIIKQNTDVNSVGEKILIDVNASEAVRLIMNNDYCNSKLSNFWDKTSFQKKVSELVSGLLSDKKLAPRLDSKCKNCEYRCEPINPLASGFNECWGDKINSENIMEPFIFDVWYFQYYKSDSILNTGRFLMRDLTQNDFDLEQSRDEGLSRQERQWLQIEIAKKIKNEKYLDRNLLLKTFKNWKFPLHFIDFETSMVAVPFNKGRHPYEQIAFQFSHHILDKNEKIKHIGQYINIEPGKFPNFEFVRALKKELENDDGTIFRYADHENTVLCQIIEQLESSNEPDKEDLMNWIKTITSKNTEWVGERSMVDLCDLIVKCYYHPLMNGSNGLKKVLPVLIQDSKYIQNKYKNPIYGVQDGIESLNYKNWAWIQFDQDNSIKDLYKLLSYNSDDPNSGQKHVIERKAISDGGAAMTAYAKLQFTDMPEKERDRIRSELLKYCELDTFAMVLLYEYFFTELTEHYLIDGNSLDE